MSYYTDTTEFDRLKIILTQCEDILNERQSGTLNNDRMHTTHVLDPADTSSTHYDEEENFNCFFKICEHMVQSPSTSTIVSCVNQKFNNVVQSPSTPTGFGGNKTCSVVVQHSPAVIQVGNGQRRFSVITDTENHIKRFNLMGRRILFKMLDPPEHENPIIWFKNSMTDLFDYMTSTIPSSEYVGMILRTPRMESGPAWISFRRADQLHIDVV